MYKNDEVEEEFALTFGQNRKIPFKTRSLIGRSAMSDGGAISPEGTQAFSKASYHACFPINTGEGSLTTNYLITHKYQEDRDYFDVISGTIFAKTMYRIFSKILGNRVAKKTL